MQLVRNILNLADQQQHKVISQASLCACSCMTGVRGHMSLPDLLDAASIPPFSVTLPSRVPGHLHQSCRPDCCQSSTAAMHMAGATLAAEISSVPTLTASLIQGLMLAAVTASAMPHLGHLRAGYLQPLLRLVMPAQMPEQPELLAFRDILQAPHT